MSNRIALDLKKFKHIKSDDNSTTLAHQDGHLLTIAHSKLSPEFKGQLSALSKLPQASETTNQAAEAKSKMAEGGIPDKNPNNPKLSESMKTPREVKYCSYCGKMAHGGECTEPVETPSVPGMAEGGKTKPISNEETNNTAGKLKEIKEREWKAPHGSIILPEQKKQNLGRVKLMAEGDTPEGAPSLSQLGNMQPSVGDNVQSTPTALQSQPLPNMPTTVNQASPSLDPLQKTRKMYDDIIRTSPKLKDIPSQVAGSFTFENSKNSPQDFDPELWDRAKNMVTKQDDMEAGAQIAQQAQQQRQAQAMAEAGITPPAPLPTPQPDEQQQIQQLDQMTAQQAPAIQEQPQPQANTNDPQSMIEQGLQSQISGINQEAVAKGNLGAQQNDALNQRIQAEQVAQNHYQQQFNDLNTERQNHIKDIQNGYIDPQKYWDNHSKLAAGIGMILAGFNPTSQPNAAINYIKYQMDQNMQAQMKNLDAKNNLLTANLHQFGNLKDATDMTRLMQNDMVTNQLQAAAAKAQSPMAKAAAMQAIGQLQVQTAPVMQQFAMRRAMMNMGSNPNQDPHAIEAMLNYMRPLNPEMAKEMESRYVPGVGLGSVPVPAEVRGQLVAKQQLGNALNDMITWSKSHSGSLNPKDIAAGKTMAANLQNLYREGINGGVFKKGEQEFIDQIVDSDPTKFFNSIRVLPKLQEVARQNSSSNNVLKHSYGLPSQQAQAPAVQDSQAALNWAKSNPKDPRAAKILSLLGK